jgi:YfiH family protein
MMRWRERQGVRWLEADLPGARAAFSARVGGVSPSPFDSLNLGLLTGDERDAVLSNRLGLVGALELDASRVLIGRQVHGPEIAFHREAQQPGLFANPGPAPEEVDGQATDAPGLAPIVLVADCLPVALSGPGGVAMIHCGWRGLRDGIVGRGVDAVDATAAAIGPGIGPCCYAVGEEVLDAFGALGEGIARGRMLDLREVARRLLADAGVAEVEASDLCTSCNPELFFSHRRDDGRTGRQAGLVWLA